jgi:diguanylate cyclase (GGDEF)-like protein
LAETQRISIAVLTRNQDDVEIVNKSLRDAGHPVHCYWVKQSQLFDRLLAERRLELILLNCDAYPDTIRQACKQRDGFQPEVPLLAINVRTDEVTMADAMNQGACDLVSLENRNRLQAVVSRELRAFRVERALNATLQSATTYRKQLHDYMEGSNSAIAYVQEGIVTRVNGAWLQMFRIGKKDEIVGMPLMDAFEPESQAAVKGAIIATTRKKWQAGEKLNVKSRLGGSDVQAVDVEFLLAEFEDGPHVQVRIAPPLRKTEEPTKLVHDALFFHRAQFLERLTKRLAKKPASGLHLLAYIKPDSFSEVIDKAGIIASEDVLGLFAEEVRKRLHPRDLAGRFEGTALLVLLERGSERDAEGWGKQLARHIAKQRFDVGGREIGLTCTVGICPVSGVFENLDELVSATKAAHRSGKSAGGNQAAVNAAVDEDTKLKRHDQIWVKRIKAALIERR